MVDTEVARLSSACLCRMRSAKGPSDSGTFCSSSPSRSTASSSSSWRARSQLLQLHVDEYEPVLLQYEEPEEE